ncbi:MAG TPA: MlaD family protein, partial [Flavitalea sp.]|nr:MlaD family protein [Flavitalea sp.]
MNNRKSVILGLFILFGIAIVVVGVLTLGGQKKSFVKSVHINAVFDDVNGLSVGNNIWFNGVKVGTIKSIGFNQAADVMVEMSIEEKVMKYIASDAKVKIGSDGLIGNKIIVIYGGSAGAPRVAANGSLKVETTLSTEELMGTLQENNKNLLAITSDFKAISSKLASGQGSIGKLLTDESLYNDLRTTMTGLKRASDNASHLTNDLSGFTAKLNEKGTLANELVTDT